MARIFVLVRAVTYAAVFVGFVLVFLPSQVLEASGIGRPGAIGPRQIAGIAVTASGAALTVWCILTFAITGKGTPAPFDPPRGLVTQGPYRAVRNPMYIGAGLALMGAALYYQSVQLLIYAASFLLLMHLFVVLYEQPALRRNFGEGYEGYCRRIGRWWPRR